MSKRALKRLEMCICFVLCVMFLGQVTVFADEVKPVHEYNFDNDVTYWVYDSAIENAINGVSYGTNRERLVTGYNGIGKARYFNGTDDYLDFSNYQIHTGAKSIRLKMKKDASTLSNNFETIIASYGADFWGGYLIGIGSTILNDRYSLSSKKGTFYIAAFNSNQTLNFEIQTPESICDGQWHDILFTWDGTLNTNSIKLYLDDMTTPVAQTTPSKAVDESRVFTYMGKSRASFSDYIIKAIGLTDKNKYFWYKGYLDNVQIYNTAITPESSTPVVSSNLTATGGTSKIDLTWDAVDKATSYAIKRSTTAGGPYTTIATDIAETSYTDTDVTSGTTYYYIVTAVNTGTEITDSNEASAEPTADQTPPTTEAKLKVVLEVAESLRLSVDDDLNVNTQMAWSSSDPTVATVNEKGIVTALATGNTIITVKSVDGSYTDYINVLVVENADDYRLAIDLKVGETARLTADDFTNTANVTWAPMDSSIANVTTKGKVTALSKGLVLITAKDTEGNIIGRVYVRVRE